MKCKKVQKREKNTISQLFITFETETKTSANGPRNLIVFVYF